MSIGSHILNPRLKVVLKSDSQQIDEVMVVAYGTAKRASFTGAASTVKGDKVLKDIPVTSFEEALSGTTPGLTINSTSGQPGQDYRSVCGVPVL